MRKIVLTYAVLHNILRSQYNGQHGGQQPEDDEVVVDGQLVGGDGDSEKLERDYLRDHFNNEKAVAWQDDRI